MRGLVVDGEVAGVDPGDGLGKSDADLGKGEDVPRRRIETGHDRRFEVRSGRDQLRVHHEVAAGQVDVEDLDCDEVLAFDQEALRVGQFKGFEGARFVIGAGGGVIGRIAGRVLGAHEAPIDPDREAVVVIHHQVEP